MTFSGYKVFILFLIVDQLPRTHRDIETKRPLNGKTNGVKKTFDCPQAIKFYNEFIPGVDRSDQYSTTYEVDRKSNKWWKRVFHRLLMVAVTFFIHAYKSR